MCPRETVRHDRLEATLQRGVLLDVLPVLVQGGGADGVQLPACEHRLEHVAGVHRALGCACAYDRVQLVDKQDDLAGRVGHFLEHGLEPLLEFAAVLRARDERAHVQRNHALVLQPFGHVPAHDAASQPLHDRGLADARLTDEHGVILRAAAQNLDGAPDFFVAADDRVELALPRHLRQVARFSSAWYVASGLAGGALAADGREA